MSNQAIVSSEYVEKVEQSVQKKLAEKRMDVPPNYSVGNAMRAAFLELQDTEDKNGKPVLEVCTKSSIANVLLSMTLMGLNPMKDQTYFIAYGNQLACQPSVFGYERMVKTFTPAQDVNAVVVVEGDEIDMDVRKTKIVINNHDTTFKNRLNGKIVAAYATIEFPKGKEDRTDFMTLDQLKTSWSQGNYNQNRDGQNQDKFTEEFAKKTVKRRVCKDYINSSDDAAVIRDRVQQNEISIEEAKSRQQIEESNTETVTLEKDQEDDQEIKKEDVQQPDQEPARPQPEEDQSEEKETTQDEETETENNEPDWG